MTHRVLTEVTGGVAHVRLHRADKLNALDAAMFDELIACGEALGARDDIRAIVLSGDGPSFCAGLDASLFARMVPGEHADLNAPAGARKLAERTHGIANRPQRLATVWADAQAPVVCAIHGNCLGGGLQMALGADVRLVTADARLSIMEIRWGLVPDMAGFIYARHTVRADILAELVYTGRIVKGDEAVQLGLATRVCGDPVSDALALAQEIASRSPDAVRSAKRLMRHVRASDDATLLLAESTEQDALIGSPNQVEAVRANLEKRPPRFS